MRLTSFPTPYPDEILYSIMCRHHMRSGNSNARRTNLDLWGNGYGKKLFLPDGIERIAAQIPQGADLAAERFINDNTIFPLLKPFLQKEKCVALSAAMRFGDPSIYNLFSFARVFTQQHRALRYCEQCVKRDAERYGEPYWHRVHQLPGVFVCPIHNVATVESDVKSGEVRNGYYPLLETAHNSARVYESDVFEKLLNFARDTLWMLQHGCELGFSEDTDALYDDWLRAKGYRNSNGQTSGKLLAQDVAEYYGQEFLSLLDAYNSGAYTWIWSLTQLNSFRHPLYQLLLIRFLAGYPSSFFEGTRQKRPEHLP